MEDLKNIVETINNSDNWLDCLPECEKLCELAGLSEKWEKSDGKSFEVMLIEASRKLKVNIGL